MKLYFESCYLNKNEDNFWCKHLKYFQSWLNVTGTKLFHCHQSSLYNTVVLRKDTFGANREQTEMTFIIHY